ncbi:MAG TPA: hypothetical protein PKE00_13355 [Planctomycetota bacterium]|nr:hypothetical protein [Planctomycetota bacterium]
MFSIEVSYVEALSLNCVASFELACGIARDAAQICTEAAVGMSVDVLECALTLEAAQEDFLRGVVEV